MKNSIVLFCVLFLFCFCNNKDKLKCTDIDDILNINTSDVTLKLPSYFIIDSINYSLDRSEIYYRKIKMKNDSINGFIVVSDYGMSEKKALLNRLDILSNFNTQNIEYYLTEKNKIFDTILSIENTKVGYIKYLIDEQKTTYNNRSNKKYYSAVIFFFKKENLIEINLTEKYKSNEFNKNSVIDCILENLETN